MINRKQYLDQLIGFRDKQLIKVITGVRRCGKSTLMELFQQYLVSIGVTKEQIISINFEDYEFEELKDPKVLYKFIKEKIIEDKQMYIFLDEIQGVKEFPKVVDSLFIKKNVDLYITGSNAYMLSTEIATLLSGRYIEIKMLPLSFREYVYATDGYANLEVSYKKYLENSSFPYALELDGDLQKVKLYLNDIFNTIIIKDVTARRKFQDEMMLDSVIRFIFDNIGNQLSTKKISDTMTSNGRTINVRTVESYLKALMESNIIYQAKRYDIKGKQYLKTLEKYYMVDIGIRYAILGYRDTDVGHILENIIYLELIRRGYEVYIGKVGELEVDFVAKNHNGTIYYQISASVRDPKTLQRELAPLQKISDHYPKFLLTLDMDPIADYDGIKRINALDFLMAGDSIYEAYVRGIVTGNPDGTFMPKRHVTRAEFCALLLRALEVPESVIRGRGYSKTKFNDMQGYAWAIPYVSYCEEKGIVLGDEEGNIHPGRTISVKEAVTMAMRAKGIVLEDGVWPSNYLTKAQELDLYVDYIKNGPVDRETATKIICAIFGFSI